MPFAGLLETMMAGKFEWQFKYRDERGVNAEAARLRRKSEEACFISVFAASVAIGLPFDLANR